MFTIPADAPAWVVYAYWLALAVFGALFAILTPRLRSLVGRVTTPVPDPAMRAVGMALGGSLDATKIAHELERIADAAETIAEAAKSLAKSEEQGTHRMLEQIAERLAVFDRVRDGR